jgi:hypothetical protein
MRTGGAMVPCKWQNIALIYRSPETGYHFAHRLQEQSLFYVIITQGLFDFPTKGAIL